MKNKKYVDAFLLGNVRTSKWKQTKIYNIYEFPILIVRLAKFKNAEFLKGRFFKTSNSQMVKLP